MCLRVGTDGDPRRRCGDTLQLFYSYLIFKFVGKLVPHRTHRQTHRQTRIHPQQQRRRAVRFGSPYFHFHTSYTFTLGRSQHIVGIIWYRLLSNFAKFSNPWNTNCKITHRTPSVCFQNEIKRIFCSWITIHHIAEKFFPFLMGGWRMGDEETSGG